MNSIAEFLANPLVWKMLIGYWLFASAVGALPELKADSPAWYAFTFRFLHGFAGNLKSAATRFNLPQNP
jgi:hypothetical protein